MWFADPLAVTCPGCGAESSHNYLDLLLLRPACPACGSALDAVGRRLGALVDEASGPAAWAEVMIEAEDRLGVPPPGVPDGDVFGTKPLVELTLRDLTRAVAEHVPTAEEKVVRAVLESAAKFAGRPVTAADLDRPLLQRWASGSG